MVEPFSPEAILVALLIFVARMADVSIAVVRTICVTRGHPVLAVSLGFFESLIWIVAVSQVFSRLDRPLNILAFAGGFAAGNAVGMWLEGKLAFGKQLVSFISRGSAQAVAERLRFAGYRVTTMSGRGREGPVSICMVMVPRRHTRRVAQMARDIDAGVVVTVEDVRETSAVIGAESDGSALPTVGDRRLLVRPALWLSWLRGHPR